MIKAYFISLIGNNLLKVVVYTMARIGYPKLGYPRVIPGPEPNFGYGLGWVSV